MPKMNEYCQSLQQSAIRAASERVAAVDGINLGQGVCDLPTPLTIKTEAYRAISENKSTYSPCEGIYPLREKIANKVKEYNGVSVDADSDIVITHGSTGAFVSALNVLFNPGENLILFEPFYGYHKNLCQLHKVGVKTVDIDINDFSIDLNQLEDAIDANTKAIVICTPNNPTGKVYSREELLQIGEIAKRHDLWLITDEIYEYIIYPGFTHTSIASLADFKDRTITISGFSKTYNMTGWRLGYAYGPSDVIEKMSLVQDLLYVCPATPLQYAVCAAFDLQADYYQDLSKSYLDKRDLVTEALHHMNFELGVPQGAYYILAKANQSHIENAKELTKMLLHEAKVAVVPGGAFYSDPTKGEHQIRLCYALSESKLVRALQQMHQALLAKEERSRQSWVVS